MRKLRVFFIGLPIFLAFVWGSSYFLKPQIETALQSIKPRVEKFISDFFQSNVKFQGVEARQVNLHPEIKVLGLEVFDTQCLVQKECKPVLRVAQITLEFDLWKSLLKLRPQIGKILAEGVYLKIKETEPNQWRVTGFPPHTTSDASYSNPMEWIPAQLDFDLLQADLKVQALGHAATEIKIKEQKSDLHISLANSNLKGHIQLKQLSVSNSELWLRPSEWNNIQLEFGWNPQENLVELRKFAAQAQNLELKGLISYHIPSGKVDSKFDIQATQIQALRKIIPFSILPMSSHVWLDTFIQEGSIERGNLILQGYPAEWKGLQSFDSKRNIFELSLPFKQLKLDYLAEWPPLQKGLGQCHVMSRTLDCRLDGAETSDFQLREVSAHIEDLAAKNYSLQLDLGLQAKSGEKLETFLRTGPFKIKANSILDLVYPTGPLETKIHLVIPFGSHNSDWKGTAEFQEASFRVLDLLKKPGSKLDLTQIRGKVDFSEKSVQATDLQAFFYGEPCQLNLKHEQSEKGPVSTSVEFISKIPSSELNSFASYFPIEKVLNGKVASNLKVKLRYPEGKTETQIHFETDLLDSEILVPAPFWKASNAALYASISAVFDGNELRNLEGSFREPKTKHAVASFKVAQGSLTKNKNEKNWQINTFFEGEEISVEDWKDFLNEFKAVGDTESGFQNKIEVFNSHIKFDRIIWDSLEMDESSIHVEKRGENWNVQIQSKQADGTLRYSEKKLLETRLKYLSLPYFPWNKPKAVVQTKAEPSQTSEVVANWNLGKWPSLDVRCDRFEVEGRKLGSLRVLIEQTGESLAFKDLDLHGGEFELKFKIGESVYHGQKPQTMFEGVLSMVDGIPPFKFKAMKFAELFHGKFEFKLLWPGGLDQFSSKTLEAQISGHVRNGKLVGVNSVVEGIVNALSLNPADSRKQIMRFEKLYLQMGIKAGEIRADVARALFGSVYMKTTGTSQIETESLQLTTQVTPSVEEIGDDPDQEIEEAHNFLTHSYRITGTWSDPKVGLKVF